MHLHKIKVKCVYLRFICLDSPNSKPIFSKKSKNFWSSQNKHLVAIYDQDRIISSKHKKKRKREVIILAKNHLENLTIVRFLKIFSSKIDFNGTIISYYKVICNYQDNRQLDNRSIGNRIDNRQLPRQLGNFKSNWW